MKCPTCQAKLLPVNGEMFCLQCGTAVRAATGDAGRGPSLEDTTDPILQKAILDAVRHPVDFRLPVSVVAPSKTARSFQSAQSIMAVPLVALASAGPVGPALTIPVPKPPVKPLAEPAVLPARSKHQGIRFRLPAISVAWGMGLSIFAVFVLLNVALSSYYANRAYPGVKVSSVAVGGLLESQVETRIGDRIGMPGLHAVVGGQTIELDAATLGSVNYRASAAAAVATGRATPLPLAAVIESYFSKPLAPEIETNSQAINVAVRQLATAVNQIPTSAVPVIDGANAFVISSKAGRELDLSTAASSIQRALRTRLEAQIPVATLDPAISTSAYAPDLVQAQKIMALDLKIVVKSASYSVSAQTIGSWLVFGKPTVGVVVNGAQVAAYISSLPGTFDRAATTSAMLSAIANRTSLQYSASTAKTTAAPVLPNTSAAHPLSTYRYCVDEGSSSQQPTVASVMSGALADKSGWSLGGRLAFVQESSGCNLVIRLLPANEMKILSSSCADQSTCQVGNVIGLNLDNWQKAAVSWKGGTAAYRTGMVDYAVGNWLGFENATCSVKASAVPILASPTLILDGCSPDWYQIPAAQAGKIQPGF